MSLFSFISKQFIDILEWQEEGDGVLAWRYPMQDNEIQYGASLTVRESQMAVFINEGKIADVFGPGMHKLTTQTLPVLTYLKNWDKLFESPFKSDLVFFSTRLQLGRKWGTPQPVTLRDQDFGMVRLRAFGIYSYRITDPKLFYTEVSGTRERYTVDDMEQQLRNQVVAGMAGALGGSGVPFLDMAANQGLMASTLQQALAPTFARYGLALDSFAVEKHLAAGRAAKSHRQAHRYRHGRRPEPIHPLPGGRSHPAGRAERRRPGRPGRRAVCRHGRGAGNGPGAAAKPGHTGPRRLGKRGSGPCSRQPAGQTGTAQRGCWTAA